MTITRLTPADVRPTIEEKQVRWLGRVAGFDYAEHKGVEYAVTINPVDPRAYSRQPGEVTINKRVREVFEGTNLERNNSHRGTIVASGTYAALVAKQAAAKARADRKATPRLLDALAVHPLLRRQAAEYLRVRPETEMSIAGIEGATRGIVIPAHEQKRGPEAILAVLRQKGTELRLSADQSAIVPVAEMGQGDGVRELIERSTPLLLAHLRGQPLRCQLKHSEKQPPEAMSLLVGGAAACEQHLNGELAP